MLPVLIIIVLVSLVCLTDLPRWKTWLATFLQAVGFGFRRAQSFASTGYNGLKYRTYQAGSVSISTTSNMKVWLQETSIHVTALPNAFSQGLSYVQNSTSRAVGLTAAIESQSITSAPSTAKYAVMFYFCALPFTCAVSPAGSALNHSFDTTHKSLIHYFQRYNGIRLEEVNMNFTTLSDAISLQAQGLQYVLQPDLALYAFYSDMIAALESAHTVVGMTVDLSTKSDNLGSTYETSLTNILNDLSVLISRTKDSPVSSKRTLDSILTDHTTVVQSRLHAVHSQATRVNAFIESTRIHLEEARDAKDGIHPNWNRVRHSASSPILLSSTPSFEENVLASAIEVLEPLLDFLIPRAEQYGDLVGDLERACAAADQDTSAVVDARYRWMAGKEKETVKEQIAGWRDWAKGSALAQFQEMDKSFQTQRKNARAEAEKRGDTTMFTSSGRGGGGQKTMFSSAPKEYKKYWAGMSNEQYEMYIGYWEKNGRREEDTNAPLWAPLRSTLVPGQRGKLDFDQMSDAEYGEWQRRRWEQQRAEIAEARKAALRKFGHQNSESDS